MVAVQNPTRVWPQAVIDRFWAKVLKTDTCWLWTSTRIKNGYGRFTIGGKKVLAHRFAYELLVGPIPEGLELDHVKARGCTNRYCVNPAHLEPVTSIENGRRGNSALVSGAWQRAKTHCPRGHAYSEANTYVVARTGHRQCRACLPIRRRALVAHAGAAA